MRSVGQDAGLAPLPARRVWIVQESGGEVQAVEPAAGSADLRWDDVSLGDDGSCFGVGELGALDVAAGVASAVYGPGVGALWGLSAARVQGAAWTGSVP